MGRRTMSMTHAGTRWEINLHDIAAPPEPVQIIQVGPGIFMSRGQLQGFFQGGAGFREPVQQT